MPGVGAEDERRRAVRIHMVGAVLRVIFDDKDRRLGPELRVADRLDELAQREIVVADIRGWGELPGGRAVRMIVGQTENLQAGHITRCLESLQLGDESRGTFYVR